MSTDLMRATIDTIWPKGSAWRVALGSDTDNLLNGIADNWETIRQFLSDMSSVRDPNFTTFLADLEKEFGILTNESLTEAQRRAGLNSIVFNRSSNGSVDAMQQSLDAAGFSVQVHENSPAVDPDIFLDQAFQMVADAGNAYAGRSDAFAGRIGGELLVNGDVFETRRIYDSVAGTMYAGTAGAGEYTVLERTRLEYETPIDPNDWPFVFFIGGDATRDIAGELTDIDIAMIPSEQEQEFKRIVLRNKPIHSWAGLIVTYT